MKWPTSSCSKAGSFRPAGGGAQEDFNYQAHYGGTWRVPLVVLVDGDSASASEIFAAAIKDNARGDIVGQKSYGKGSVQGIFPLGYAGAGIRLTTALFYSPNGQKISKHGVMPNIPIESARTAAKPIQQPVDDRGERRSGRVHRREAEHGRQRIDDRRAGRGAGSGRAGGGFGGPAAVGDAGG